MIHCTTNHSGVKVLKIEVKISYIVVYILILGARIAHIGGAWKRSENNE